MDNGFKKNQRVIVLKLVQNQIPIGIYKLVVVLKKKSVLIKEMMIWRFVDLKIVKQVLFFLIQQK